MDILERRSKLLEQRKETLYNYLNRLPIFKKVEWKTSFMADQLPTLNLALDEDLVPHYNEAVKGGAVLYDNKGNPVGVLKPATLSPEFILLCQLIRRLPKKVEEVGGINLVPGK